ncbi:actin cortical patch SUR7/pH-response regulator pali [Pyronema omphalodes]|nr:actin cortical patch SUR7/pH-response regulator pali [Pyronema omphalodes]
MIRLAAIFPIALSIAAFILSLLTLLSGKDPKFLTDVFILRVNTTQIGTNVDIPSLLSTAGINPGNSAVDAVLSRLPSGEIGNILNTAARNLGLHDYYSAYPSTYCRGSSIQDNNSHSTRELITNCTTPQFPFEFDPVAILESDLLKGVTLEQLNFPTQDVNRVVNALKTAYKVMNILYLVGVILAGVSILTGLAGFMASRLLEFLNQLVAFLALLALGVASAIATVFATRVRDIFNQKAAQINVSADRSGKFLGMTWAAVACLLLVVMSWCVVCCCGRHRGRGKEGVYEEREMRESRRGWGRRERV